MMYIITLAVRVWAGSAASGKIGKVNLSNGIPVLTQVANLRVGFYIDLSKK